MARQCLYCKKSYDDSVVFCGDCGRKTVSEYLPGSILATKSATIDITVLYELIKSINNKMTFFTVVLILTMIGGCIFSFYFGSAFTKVLGR